MGNLNLKFTDEQLLSLQQKKLDLRVKKKLSKLNWEDAVLYAFEVKK